MSNFALHTYTTFCLPIHPSVDTWIVSAFLAIVNNATVNIGVQISV